MKEKVSAFWFSLLRQQLRFRYPLAAVILIVTAVFCWGIYTKLTVKTDFFALYPPSHPYIKLYKEFRTMFVKFEPNALNRLQRVPFRRQILAGMRAWQTCRLPNSFGPLR